jgi:2-methylisocitrate lyase-like PEP mutase family enzyme
LRTDTFRFSGINAAIERVRAYQQTGVDAIFVPGVQKRKDLEKIRKNISLPAVTSGLPKTEGDKSGLKILQEIGYCMTVLAKFPFMIVVKTLYDSLSHLKENGELGPFEEKMASSRMLEEIIRADQYEDYQKRFMMVAKKSSIQKK